MNTAAAKNKKAMEEKQRIITPTFRVSYPHLFKPQGMKGAEPKYSITMLFAKMVNGKENEEFKKMKVALKYAKVAAFGPNKEDWPKMDSPIQDGDSPKYIDRLGYKGHWAIKASSHQDQKPGVVAQDGKELITNPSDLYPGCYARAYVFARAWEFGGKHGVHFILDHVQKVAEGKAFGGKKPVGEVFSPIEIEDTEDAEIEDEENFGDSSDTESDDE